MGHISNMWSFAETTPKGVITAEIHQYVCNEEHSSLNGAIRWLSPICKDYHEAQEYLKQNDNGWYDNLAVRYRKPKPGVTNEKLKEMTAKRHELTGKIRNLEDEIAAKKVKAQLISCKHCGSKLNKDYLKSNFCPLCHADMRSQTVQDNLKRLKERRDKIDEKIQVENRKLAEHGTIHWLVKFEYHA